MRSWFQVYVDNTINNPHVHSVPFMSEVPLMDSLISLLWAIISKTARMGFIWRKRWGREKPNLEKKTPHVWAVLIFLLPYDRGIPDICNSNTVVDKPEQITLTVLMNVMKCILETSSKYLEWPIRVDALGRWEGIVGASIEVDQPDHYVERLHQADNLKI